MYIVIPRAITKKAIESNTPQRTINKDRIIKIGQVTHRKAIREIQKNKKQWK